MEALESERSAWKHLSKKEMRELENERSQKKKMCKMKGEWHLYIGGAPTDLSTKGTKKLNKKINQKKKVIKKHMTRLRKLSYFKIGYIFD